MNFHKTWIAVLLTFFSLAQAFADSVKPEVAIADALRAYMQLPALASTTAMRSEKFPTVLRVALGENSAGGSQYRVVLALAQKGAPKPLGDWDLRTVRILQLDYSANAVMKNVSDITLAGLPSGTFDACFWIKLRDSNAAGGRACFPLSRVEDMLWIRLWAMGIYKIRIPWRHANGTVVYTEMAPEECDGAFDDQSHAFGWCPWSASFEGVFRNSSHAEGLFELP